MSDEDPVKWSIKTLSRSYSKSSESSSSSSPSPSSPSSSSRSLLLLSSASSSPACPHVCVCVCVCVTSQVVIASTSDTARHYTTAPKQSSTAASAGTGILSHNFWTALITGCPFSLTHPLSLICIKRTHLAPHHALRHAWVTGEPKIVDVVLVCLLHTYIGIFMACIGAWRHAPNLMPALFCGFTPSSSDRQRQ
jgi:hypothetical protein